MIAACPKCRARYRVDEAKIGAEGVRLRCAKCEAVFRVRAPKETAPPASPPAAASEAMAPPTAPAPTPPGAAEVTAPQPSVEIPATRPDAAAPTAGASDDFDHERLVLVADPDAARGQKTVEAAASWGLQTILCHDGVEAMMTIQRSLPRVVVLDAALPKMYGFQICEVIKRNESLRNTRVILVGAINDQDRYRRPPQDLYGADLYLEQPTLISGLQNACRDFGLPMGAAPSAPAAPAPQPQAARAPAPAAAPAPAPAPSANDGLEEERSQAERLARIIVSDIILYHPEKFEEAIRAGNVVEALDQGIEEGRTLFRQRIDERVREEKDFIVEELLRVARERGMQ